MPSNLGVQQIHIKFFDDVTNTNVNFVALDIRKTGIYSGGYLTLVDNTSVTLSTFKCEIADSGSTGNQIRCSTAATVTITVGSATPYVVMRWTYTGVAADDYVAFLALASGSVLATDLIIGVCSFSGTTLIGINYTSRSTPNVHDLFLKVEPEQTPSMYLRVRAGKANYGTTNYDIVDQKTSVITAPGSGSRIDLVQISISGTIVITPGTASATPTAPSYGGLVTLAEVTIAAGQATITSTSIKDVRNFIAGAVPPNTYVDLTNIQTVAGVKTFSSSPIVPTPTTDYQASTKKYIDDLDVANVKVTGNQAVAGAKTLSGLTSTTGGLVLENRTNDTGCTQTGRIWLRTDL